MTENAWAFGWTQVLTIIGFTITIGIAIGGFRTFGRWRREKLEEERIAVALEALALTFESKYVFENIRSPAGYASEWQDLPKQPFKDDDQWNRRGAFYAPGKRVRDHKDFFERAFRLQPKCMALLGKECEDVFMKMHRARRRIEVSSQMLTFGESNLSPELHQRLERDIWDLDFENDGVGNQLREFREEMEALCKPVIDGSYGRQAGRSWLKRLRSDPLPPKKKWEVVKNG